MRAKTGNSLAAVAVTLLTVVWGIGYAIEGSYLILVWATVFPGDINDLSFHIIMRFEPGLAFLAGFGVLFLVLGIMALVAAQGFYWRRWSGRFLMFGVAVLAISLGLCWLGLGPWIRNATNVPLGVAQVFYGVLALAILSMNRVEPAGIHILRLLCILVGLPLILSFCSTDFISSFTSRVDAGSRFLALYELSYFIAGWLILATGVGLLIPRLKRFVTAVGLMIAASMAEAAMAGFALLGAFLGQSREGLREGFLLFFYFPFTLVLLLLTASGVWYLRRPAVRRALEAEQEDSQGSPQLS